MQRLVALAFLILLPAWLGLGWGSQGPTSQPEPKRDARPKAALGPAPVNAAPAGPGRTGLDVGYHQLYDLEFAAAHATFADWRKAHPADPLGPASDAAVYLFAELHRMGVLEARFFAQDADFLAGPAGTTDPGFDPDLEAAGALARQALAAWPNDINALYAEALCHGLRADDLGIVHKRYVASLGEMKEAQAAAARVLALDPGYGDAYLAGGVENYVLGLKPAPVRWLLRLDGARADKSAGLRALRRAADSGHYLQPFARILLAIAALRDGDLVQARILTAGLAEDFPGNPLYARELARLGEATATLEPDATRIGFQLGAFLHTVHGTFALSRGRMVWDPASGVASGAMVIGAATGDSGNADRDRDMCEKVLEADRFPEITFRPASVEGAVPRAGRARVVVHGTLELHGASHNVGLPLEVSVADGRFQARGELTIPYVAWGLKDPSNVLLRVAKTVGVEITAAGTVDWPEQKLDRMSGRRRSGASKIE